MRTKTATKRLLELSTLSNGSTERLAQRGRSGHIGKQDADQLSLFCHERTSPLRDACFLVEIGTRTGRYEEC